MRFLRDVRLDQARALLLSGRARAGEAGLQVGFENAAHFAREFKRRHGHAPAQYVRHMDATWSRMTAVPE